MHGLDLHTIADMVNGADSPEAAWQAFHAALSQHGLDRAVLHVDLPRHAANPFADHPGARTFGTFWDAGLDGRLRGFAGDVRRAEDEELRHLRPTLTFLSMFRSPLFIEHLEVVKRPRHTAFVPISQTMLEMGQYQALVLPLDGPRSRRLSTLCFWGDDPGSGFSQFVGAHMGALQAAGLCLAAFLALRWSPTRTPGDTPALSTRERQILSALAEGAQIDGIADGLGISERSVREYIARARAKLGARTRTEAVSRALMMGMIDPGR
ncbi:MAG: helix-turn-helix transcriptional regulator [Alkalilacustris sp.]